MTASLSASWTRGLALVTIGLLALLLAWAGVRLFWLLVGGPQVANLPMPPIPQVQASAAAREGFRWDLFGEAPASQLLVAAPVVESSGRLRLKGVMSGGAAAFAIIADEQGRERAYRVGAELPDGTRVEEIDPLRVIVQRNGRREALELSRRSPASSPSPRTTGAAERPQLPGIRGFEAPPGISAASLQAPGPAATSVAEQISVMPVAGGGFRVRPGRDARLFSQIGLQINDVVIAVNGQPLASEDEARAMFSEVLRSGELSITINRQGREMTLRPDLDQILARLSD